MPLAAATLKNPQPILAGRAVTFHVELKPGSWIECTGPEDCTAWGAKGEPLGKILPMGEGLALGPGVTFVEFKSDSGTGPQPRARVTVFAEEPAL